jgi:predicted PhzF superfamily epimerase YddE/YHI9
MDMQKWRDSRTQAENATTVLRDALAALGLPERVQQHLRPMVTHSGAPFVHVGILSADHVELIAEALRDSTVAYQESGS